MIPGILLVSIPTTRVPIEQLYEHVRFSVKHVQQRTQCTVVQYKLVAARLKKGTAQSLRLANSACIYQLIYILLYYSLDKLFWIKK